MYVYVYTYIQAIFLQLFDKTVLNHVISSSPSAFDKITSSFFFLLKITRKKGLSFVYLMLTQYNLPRKCLIMKLAIFYDLSHVYKSP